MRRSARAVVAATAVAVSLATVVPAAEAGPREAYEEHLGQPPRGLDPPGRLGHDWRGTPTGVAGTTSYSQGELIIEDRPFDDSGADTIPDQPALGQQDVYPGLCSGTAAYRHGEVTYPDDPAYAGNAADLVEVRLAAEAGSVHVLFQLQTLIDPQTTVVLLGIDTDGDPATGSPGWAGFEHLLVAHGSEATLGGQPVSAAVDVDANTVEARFPADAVPGRSWRVAAAAGIAGDEGPTLTDLAVHDEEIVGTYNCWHDAAQSRHLADGGFPAVTADVDALRAGRSNPPTLRRGPMVRLQVPLESFGEGIHPQPRYAENGNTAQVYGGSVQPYAAYVPDSYDPDRHNPLIVLLHCLTCNHNTFHIAAWPGLAELAERQGAVVVTPFARGEGGHYEGEAEFDVFDVLTDVQARYAVDPDRIYLTGMSMGALGTYRLGLLYPDLWARALAVGSYTTPYCVTPSQRAGCPYIPINYFRLLGNARNLPYGILNGVADELTPYSGAKEIADELAGFGYGWRFWTYPLRRHEPSLHGMTVDATAPWLADHRRVGDPARVTFRRERLLDHDELGLRYDRAYWVRDLRLADDVDVATVDATSGRGTALTTEPVSGSGNSDAGPWTMEGADPVLARIDEGNRLTVTAAGLTSLRVVTAEAGLSAEERLALVVDTDRSLTLTVDGFGSVDVAAGRTERVLSPDPGRGGPAVAPGGRIPATGGSGDGVLPLVLVALALGIHRICRVRRVRPPARR